MTGIELVQCELASKTLGNRRTIWVQRPATAATGVCVFLDGEYYFAHMRAAPVVQRLQEQRVMPALLTAYVSCIDYEIRWPESFCNPDFAKFAAEELLPWLTSQFDVPASGENTLAGLSLTGLSAAHTALLFPTAFPYVLCQSGSFWWNDCWLADHLPESSSCARFRITVGSKETDEDVDHGNGLFQKESQRASNLRMRDALVAKGHPVSYDEFEGGHDTHCWQEDLPGSLTELFRL